LLFLFYYFSIVNFLAKILLLIFLFAQSAPIIISIIDCDDEISVIDNDSEKSKEQKDYKIEFAFCNYPDFSFFCNKKSNKLSTFYLLKDYKAQSKIEILPPKQI
jgi:hypothetical protein